MERIKCFEEADEYNFEKEMCEYEKIFSSKQTENKNIKYNATELSEESKMLIKWLLTILFMLLIIFMIYIVVELYKFDSYVVSKLPIETSLGEENSVLEDELGQQIYYRLDSINFDNTGSIVALYKFDRKTVVNWGSFTERDERFIWRINE